jgi:hypothetical protein
MNLEQQLDIKSITEILLNMLQFGLKVIFNICYLFLKLKLC